MVLLLRFHTGHGTQSIDVHFPRLPYKVLRDGIIIAAPTSTLRCYAESAQRHCGQVEQGISNYLEFTDI
jgi:hypothetical protein